MVLEKNVLSKNKHITALNKHLAELKAMDEGYTQELNRMNNTINELVDSNQQNIGRMANLGQDITAKRDFIKELNEDF